MSYMSKTRMAILIHKQTISVSCAVEDCLTPRTLIEERIRSRLRLQPIPDYDGIPENLFPYVKAYWEICYHFLQGERNLLDQMITDLYSEVGYRELKEAQTAINYIDRRLEDMREAAGFFGITNED